MHGQEPCCVRSIWCRMTQLSGARQRIDDRGAGELAGGVYPILQHMQPNSVCIGQVPSPMPRPARQYVYVASSCVQVKSVNTVK